VAAARLDALRAVISIERNTAASAALQEIVALAKSNNELQRGTASARKQR